MTTRFIRSGLNDHTAAKAWAGVMASDPFAYGRTKTELALHCCSQGIPSDILRDAERIEKARHENPIRRAPAG